MPTFQTRDSTTPDFWTERFEQQFMPWDRGGVPQAFKQFVAAAPRPMTTLIPGCGMGYEVAYFARKHGITAENAVKKVLDALGVNPSENGGKVGGPLASAAKP